MSTFLGRLMCAQVAWGEIAEDAFSAKFVVVSREIEPQLPYFVGRIREGAYYISDEVKAEFRRPVIAYEHFCRVSVHIGDRNIREWTCYNAVLEELKRVDEALLKEYLEMRLKFFDGLIQYHASNRDWVQALQHARDFIQLYRCEIGWKE